VSPVKYELGFYIVEDVILHSHRRDNLKPYIPMFQFRFVLIHFVPKLFRVSHVSLGWRDWPRVLVSLRRHIASSFLRRVLPEFPNDSRAHVILR
jgi:hypothetical protein